MDETRPEEPAEGRAGASPAERSSLGGLAVLFLRLGATSFGGPAAHIAMMEHEVVRRRRWLSEDEFIDLLGATNLIPGPNSTEMAIHLGRVRAGAAGLLVAGICFVAPAALLAAALAWAYVRFAALPEVGWMLHGVKPVVLAIVAQAIAGLAPRALRTRSLVLLGAAVAVAVWLGASEIGALLAAGLASALARRMRATGSWSMAPLAGSSLAWAGAALPAPVAPTVGGLFWVFLKIGSVLFGSGYVLLAFLQAELVERLGWLSGAQLIDAIAVGQVTPGPLFTTATFVGYLVGGLPGAAAATIGIFLPAFVLVALSGPLVPRLRSSPLAGSFLDGVNAASVALMVVVTLELARDALVDLPSILFAMASALLLLTGRVGPTWLVAAGALGGWLVRGG